MSQRRVATPLFPQVPPAEYSPTFFSDLIRSFSLFVEQVNNPGEGRNTTMVVTAMPSSEYGLEPFSLWHRDGDVRIALASMPQPDGASMTAVSGEVTVAIT